MGNTLDNLTNPPTLEHATAEKLLRAIKADNASRVTSAIQLAKKELMKPSLNVNFDKDYDNNNREMLKYLTKKYDIGDGKMNMRTPLEYAKELGSHTSEEIISKAIAELQKNSTEKEFVATRESKTVGTVDQARVRQAKDRLKALRDNK